MKNLKKQLIPILTLLITSFISNSAIAQNQKLPLLELNELSIIKPMTELLPIEKLPLLRYIELSFIKPITDNLPVESEELSKTQSDILEIDQTLIDNSLESIMLELWSEDNELLIKKDFNFGDDIFTLITKQPQGKYKLLLKSKEEIITTYEYYNNFAAKL